MNIFTNLFKEISFMKLLKALEDGLASTGRALSGSKTPDISTSSASSKSRPFSEIIKEASQAYGIQEEVISAVIKQESSYNPRAVSSCGAQGLMQLMPGTARSLGVRDAFNPEENIMAGTRYLREKLDEFNGSLPLALAAYNAGSGAVKKYGGIPPYKETQAYVNKIIKSIDHLA